MLQVTLSSAAVTHEVTACLDLPKTSLRLYRLLHSVALELCRLRAHHQSAEEVAFFAPVEIVADALGVHRCTVWEHMKVLRERGLADSRPHYVEHRGRTVTDGTVWSVRLTPYKGRKARVSWYTLKGKFRDLSGDIEAGRTAWNEIRQSQNQETKPCGIKRILSWALPREAKRPPLVETVGIGLEAVLDVPYAERQDRGEAVNVAAKAMASVLRDDSLDFYRWLLWRLLRLWDYRLIDHWQDIYEMVRRAEADREEGFARSAGALFVSRLKAWRVLWEAVREMPPWAVAPAP